MSSEQGLMERAQPGTRGKKNTLLIFTLFKTTLNYFLRYQTVSSIKLVDLHLLERVQ